MSLTTNTTDPRPLVWRGAAASYGGSVRLLARGLADVETRNGNLLRNTRERRGPALYVFVSPRSVASLCARGWCVRMGVREAGA